MSEASEPQSNLPEQASGDTDPERPGDALRSAVERTLAATAGSAAETRQRARDLLDEVARRGEAARDELTRRGEAARDEVTRRGEAARDEVQRVGEEASTRVSEAIAELRSSSSEDFGRIGDRIDALESRLASIERALRGGGESEGEGARKPDSQAPQAGKTKAQPEVENSAPGTARSDPEGD
jgi:polyhydroxyalkanoate synthesis regulator phasin